MNPITVMWGTASLVFRWTVPRHYNYRGALWLFYLDRLDMWIASAVSADIRLDGREGCTAQVAIDNLRHQIGGMQKAVQVLKDTVIA